MMFGLQMFNEMESLNREMDQLLCGLGLSRSPEKRNDNAGLRVKDTGVEYKVEASLPGIDVKHLEIDVLGRQLSLSAEMADSEVGDDVIWHRRERRRKAFKKSFMLPEEIDSEQVEAEYKNGILMITLPKAASVLPKKISVKAS